MFYVGIKCPYCKHENVDDWSDYIENSDVIAERDMGPEIEHEVYCEEYTCSHCGNVFKVTGSIFEYPENAYNYDSLVGEKLEDEDEDF
ncbi:hypothetical protein [Fusobacterium sp. HC1336]|uniref:hypothetical protein n=1 Tax=Fusobacterium sp. HC1336 TaxID=3171169 RepID=UPI003F23D3FB